MSAITIRKLPDGARQRFRMRAAANGRSMEAEARAILLDALDSGRRVDLTWIEQLIGVGADLGGVDLQVPDDEPASSADLRDHPSAAADQGRDDHP